MVPLEYRPYKGDDILVVRGYRGEGKKPNCFAILIGVLLQGLGMV